MKKETHPYMVTIELWQMHEILVPSATSAADARRKAYARMARRKASSYIRRGNTDVQKLD